MASATARRTAATGLTHEVSVGTHRVTADESVAAGGADLGPDPIALVAAALASCTAITVEMYAERHALELGVVEVSAEVERAAGGEPARASVTLRIPARLEGDQLERIRSIAARCPVRRMLEATVEVQEQLETPG